MAQSASRGRQIAAAVVGNALEWYDFVVFGFVAVVISRLFFPDTDETAALLKTFLTYGVGFFMRPVGAILLGLYADRHGRKRALQLVILLMTVATAIIAFAPTYSAIGIGAPILLLVARLLQGFATGGEFASSTAFLVEVAPAGRRGLYGSLQMVGQGGSALFGAIAGWGISKGLNPDQLESWAWRLPFLVGLLIGPVGYYIRRHVEETEDFLSLGERAREASVFAVFRDHTRGFAVAFLLTVCGTTAYYGVLLYMPTWAKAQLGLPLEDAFRAQVIALVALIAIIPAAGALSDRIGRRPLLMFAALLYFTLPLPLFEWALAAPSFDRLLVVQLVMCSVVGMYFGPLATTQVEQFPTALRSTGSAMAYNFAVMIFGGFAPFILTWIIRETGTPVAPAYYIMFGALAGGAATLLLREVTGAAGPVAIKGDPGGFVVGEH